MILLDSAKMSAIMSTIMSQQFRPSRRSWVKLWVNEWLTGTVRWQLSATQRSIWIDLLALAGYSRFPGIVCSGETHGVLEPYPIDYLVSTLRSTEAEVYEAFDLFKAQGRIRADEKGVIYIINWPKYQSEYQQKRQRSRYPTNSTKSPTKLHRKSVVEVEVEVEGEVEVDGEEKQRRNNHAHFVRPSLDEVREYIQQRGSVVNPEAFFDFYESVGWRVGNKPMKKWHNAIGTWERRGQNGNQRESEAERKRRKTQEAFEQYRRECAAGNG